ncbi:MAG: YHS domain-containing protein [Proteobacteria bacterium]|nr:YHS domain-containing protein [Pseudomonadota bacterium]MBU1714363.1 YHS domain-containing protein [Pseudomonadota bacterium]
MSPARILILGLLFYILYRLLFGRGKKTAQRHDTTQGQTLAAQDVLIEDPICHTYIPKKKAVVLNRGKQTYYFCCEKCRETFITEEGDLK